MVPELKPTGGERSRRDYLRKLCTLPRAVVQKYVLLRLHSEILIVKPRAFLTGALSQASLTFLETSKVDIHIVTLVTLCALRVPLTIHAALNNLSRIGPTSPVNDQQCGRASKKSECNC